MREDALHGHADLSGVVEASLREEGNDLVRLRIGRHHDRGRPAVLQRTACAGGELRTQHPAHPAAADEAEEADSRVADQLAGHVEVGGQQGLAPGFREAGLVQDPHEAHAGERSRFRRLHDHRTARGDAGEDLVDDQVQRVIERAEGHDDADRLVPREGDPVGRGSVEIHRDTVSRLGAQAIDAALCSFDRPVHLDQRIDQRLASLARRLGGQMLAALLHDRGRTAQDLDPFGPGKPRVAVPEECVGGRERPIHDLRAGGVDGPDDGAVPRRIDLHRLARSR